jgi:hypothetical protein
MLLPIGREVQVGNKKELQRPIMMSFALTLLQRLWYITTRSKLILVS